MRQLFRFLFAFTIFLISIAICSSCRFKWTGCGDIWDKSPSELLSQNELVTLSKLSKVDTLLRLGKHDYLGSESEFFFFEYTFVNLRDLQASRKVDTFHLWVCERLDTKNDYFTGFNFKTGDSSLVYGNAIRSPDSIFLAMSPLAYVESLKKIFQGNFDVMDWNTRVLDSTLGRIMIESEALRKQFTERQSVDRIVLYCPERYCLTANHYWEGMLCYYDSIGNAHSVERYEYLEELLKISGK